jgi:hypothetical protein
MIMVAGWAGAGVIMALRRLGDPDRHDHHGVRTPARSWLGAAGRESGHKRLWKMLQSIGSRSFPMQLHMLLV